MNGADRRKPHVRRDNLQGLVGWIFADVLLALAVVFLATQAGGVAPTDTADQEASARSDKTTTTTGPQRPPGVDSQYICFRILADGALLTSGPSDARALHLADLEAQVTDRLSQPDLAGRRAGIILAFGVGGEPGIGRERAEGFNQAILPRFPNIFTRPNGQPVANRAFWDGQAAVNRPEGSIAVNVYPIIDEEHPPLPQQAEQDC